MPVTVATVSVYAGDTTDWPTYTFRAADGQLRNLVTEGWTDWRAQWRVNEDSVDFIELAVDAAQATEGTIAISASAEQTAEMDGPGIWDLQSVRGGTVKTWVRGKTKFTKDITRD